MERTIYETRMAVLGDQYATARKALCPLTAADRMRKMARLHAEYTGREEAESEAYLLSMFAQ